MEPQDSSDHALLAQLGTTTRDEVPRRFTAGELSVEFQSAGLRYLRYRGQELVRAISFLVRDENWGTYPTHITGMQVEQDAAYFSLQFHAECGAHGDDLQLEASIIGRADGSLDFEVTALVRRDFATNRTGFVVLHPLEVSGLAVAIEHVDGRVVQERFPEQIDPLQPFMQIRALTTQLAGGLAAEVRMEGDTFEMEDQRNWSDASFKTYVRPLALPWPYILSSGTKLKQAVRLKVSALADSGSEAATIATTASVSVRSQVKGAVPRLGIGVRAADLAQSLAQAAQLAALKPAYFIAHLDLRHDDVVSSMQDFSRLSQQTGVPYSLELVLSNDPAPEAVRAQLAAVAAQLASGQAGEHAQVSVPASAHAHAHAPQSIQLSSAADLKAVLPGSPWPPSPSFDTMLGAARKLFAGIALGAGSFAYFTELNRKRPEAALLDYLSFTTCPIVHAADDRSVMETLSTLPYIAYSARTLFPARPYRVGPSSIAARDNPYGSSTVPNSDGRVCLTDNDPRQRALFGASWNLAYFAQFAANGASHIALSELTGPRGLLHHQAPTPLFYLLQSLALPEHAQLLQSTVDAGPDGRRPYVIAVRDGAQLQLWLANPSAHMLAVRVELPSACQVVQGQGQVQARRWDIASPNAAPQWGPLTSDEVQLGAYETLQISAPMPQQGTPR